MCKAIARILLHLFTTALITIGIEPNMIVQWENHTRNIDNFDSVRTLEKELSVFCGNPSLVGSGGQ